MIKEDLYVISSGEKNKLNLCEPSGITIKFCSNIFGDLSKVVSSHSYTFKLPKSANNRRILDNAEDIRYQSKMSRKRIKAEYYQNGIAIIKNAYLYIESIDENYYNAAMTWNVMEGLEILKNSEMTLRDLFLDNKEADYGNFDTGIISSSFNNESDIIYPVYNAGLEYYRWDVTQYGNRYSRIVFGKALPLPVVPVYRLVKLINETFKTNFVLGEPVAPDNEIDFTSKYLDVNLGVIPLVGLNLNEKQIAAREVILSGIYHTPDGSTVKLDDDSEVKFNDVIRFNTITLQNGNDMLTTGAYRMGMPKEFKGIKYDNIGISALVDKLSVGISGSITAALDTNGRPGIDYDGDEPLLSIYQYQSYVKDDMNYGAGSRRTHRKLYRWVELSSVAGEYIGKDSTGKPIYEFNFDDNNGGESLTCNNVRTIINDNDGVPSNPLLFVVNYKLYKIESARDIKVEIQNTKDCISPHKIDIISNLPDISCFDFIKSLYYILGGYPVKNTDGSTGVVFYNDINNNISSGKVIDWSMKTNCGIDTTPNKILFTNGNLAKSNYYLMKSDSEEISKKGNENGFDNGKGTIVVENEYLEKKKTVIQLPFSAPYISNPDYPKYQSGNTFKCWHIADSVSEGEINSIFNRVEFCSPEPIYGIICDKSITLTKDGVSTSSKIMSLRAWEGFKNMNEKISYAYLQEVLRKPYFITENFILNEFDLAEIDYSMPIYIAKYAAYFAIVSITRTCSGDCTCELIKLPTNG